jgi:guanylate kinase
VGKGAVAAGLVARTPDLWLSRSWTTRPRRASDPDEAYVFVDRPAFEAEREAGGFLEWAEVFGNLYATPVPSPPAGADLLLEIDVQGATQVKRLRPDAVVICVRAPSRAAQEQRLRKRGDDEAVIARRLALADAEEEAGVALADHVVVNDDLGRAIEEAAGIVEWHRSRRSRPSPPSDAPVVPPFAEPSS